MFKKYFSYLFIKRAGKYLDETPRERRFVNYDSAKTVLLLFESDFSEKNPEVKKIIYQLQQDGKKVSAWGFLDKKEIATAILPDFRILHHKQTDLSKRPLVSYLNELENLEFDLLIDLSLKQVLTLEYIVMYAKAHCKAGLKKTDLPIYDFMIDTENVTTKADDSDIMVNTIDETYLFNQIIFYLKSIQTTD